LRSSSNIYENKSRSLIGLYDEGSVISLFGLLNGKRKSNSGSPQESVLGRERPFFFRFLVILAVPKLSLLPAQFKLSTSLLPTL
jgi:hypothetical protein